MFHWPFWAREAQLPPPTEWLVWLIQAGRGFGKTRIGAEGVRLWAQTPHTRIALVARTAADARDVMVEGESGILAVCPPSERPIYQPSKRRLVWPNGSVATTYSAEEPNKLRGPQHHKAWADEAAAWRYEDAWDQLMFGLRLGNRPQVVVTTTPKPTKTFKAILGSDGIHITRGSTHDNAANLAPSFTRRILKKYAGTRLGQQEIEGILLDDNPNALFQRGWIDKARVRKAPEMRRIIVAVDPAVKEGSSEIQESDTGDEHGIVVVGEGVDGRGYVLEDLSMHGTPNEWAQVVANAVIRWRANAIVAEKNNGGAMVEAVIRQFDKMSRVYLVWASVGKERRAEPVSLMYEQRRISHVGVFADLESQMCEFEPGLKNQASPDRMDALVWGLTFLFAGADSAVYGFDY